MIDATVAMAAMALLFVVFGALGVAGRRGGCDTCGDDARGCGACASDGAAPSGVGPDDPTGGVP